MAPLFAIYMQRFLPIAVLVGLTVGCSLDEAALPGAPPDAAAGLAPFAERAAESGLDFVHDNGMSGHLYFAEIVGSGAALFDADNDGDLDLYLVQGGDLGSEARASDPSLGDRLFRNDLTVLSDGSSRLRFTDVTEAAGIASFGYGMGVAVGDVDNDGRSDLYVTNLGANGLWLNRSVEGGGIRFVDATGEARVGDPGWGLSASFVDFDRDGWLDLYVTNYVDYEVEEDTSCKSTSGLPDYCSPLGYTSQRDRLFHNQGTGDDGRPRFEDVSESAGIRSERGNGLGVVSGDFNRDGWPDLYVANDLTPNLLWINRGDGKSFVNEALLAGCAVNGAGKAEASMGVASGDIDRDGDEDLFMTHLLSETNTLYVNQGTSSGSGRVFFADRTAAMRLGSASLGATGFGTALLDYDNDGWLDVLAVNGAVTRIEAQVNAGDPFPLHQPNHLFRNLGAGEKGRITFEDVTASAGQAFELSEVSRGTAAGDVDNDGDVDLLISNNNGPARLLINQVGSHSHWLGLRLVTGVPGRDALGAEVSLRLADGRTIRRWVRTDGSYGSANDSRLLFGLGQASDVARVEVRWQNGDRESWLIEKVDRYKTLVAGQGRLPPVDDAGGTD